jgi:hypothetical protein
MPDEAASQLRGWEEFDVDGLLRETGVKRRAVRNRTLRSNEIGTILSSDVQHPISVE